MTSTTNEAYRLDVNVQESGAGEIGVLVYGWNVQESVVINKTTDVNGDVTVTNIEVSEFNDTGTGPVETVRTPIRLRALKFGFFFEQQSLVPSARLAATFFLETNTVLTESVQATIDAYTGITYNDTTEEITLTGAGGTPVDRVERLYDNVHSRYSKAATPPQYDYRDIVGSVDKQNYVYDYDIIASGFEFDGQNRAFARSNTGARFQCTAAGGRVKDITVDYLLLSTATAGQTYANVNVNTELEFGIAGNYTWDGGTISGDIVNNAGVVNLTLVNGATFTGTATGTGTTNIINAQPINVSGVTWGTPIKVLADETVGTITKGDILLEAFADENGEASDSLNYEAAFNPLGLKVAVRARNQGVAVAAIAEDSGTGFTDETAEASSNAGNDMTLLPAVPALNDAYYFGHDAEFPRLKLDVSVALAGSGYTIVWEYFNGTVWSTLTVTDGTSDFTNLGEEVVSWTIPGDWATTTINSQGPLYYVRARLSVAGTITTAPQGRRVQLDVTRYLPYVGERRFTSTGLADIASWTPDTIAKFLPTD